MHVHYLQHQASEGLGTIEAWLQQHNHEISATRLYAGDKLPIVDDIDWLIIMGGAMSVHDEVEYPWLKTEKKFIEQAIQKNKKVLGVCLGGQLIAHVLGAKVASNRYKEIGWFPIEPIAAAKTLPAAQLFNQDMMVFHWHGDTFDLPKGAVHLAKSQACMNQAFSYGDNLLALQFHLEITEAMAKQWTQGSSEIAAGGLYVQSREHILADPKRFTELCKASDALLHYLAG